MTMITPIAETTETVTLSRADYEAMLDALEDRQDAETFEAFERTLATEGKAAALREALPSALAARLLNGEAPVRVWREHRGTTQRALAEAAGVSVGYLNDNELGRKPGSAKALRQIAVALDISVDTLLISA